MDLFFFNSKPPQTQTIFFFDFKFFLKFNLILLAHPPLTCTVKKIQIYGKKLPIFLKILHIFLFEINSVQQSWLMCNIMFLTLKCEI